MSEVEGYLFCSERKTMFSVMCWIYGLKHQDQLCSVPRFLLTHKGI
jgi:hypothetical protein